MTFLIDFEMHSYFSYLSWFGVALALFSFRTIFALDTEIN